MIPEEFDLEKLLSQQRMTNAILRGAFRTELSALRGEILDDRVMAAIVRQLGQEGGSLASGEVKAAVAAEARVSERTVIRRLVDLEQAGVIEQAGSGRSTSYELTGLIDFG